MTQMRLKKDAQGRLVIGIDGKYISEFQHYVTVLKFFAKTCIPFFREIPTFNRIEQSFHGQPVKFLYVNVDPDLTKEQAKNLLQKYRIKIPMA